MAHQNGESVVLRGSCQCGGITYSSTTLPESLTNCHCITCRLLSGAPFITFARFSSFSVTFTPSFDTLGDRTTLVKRRFSDFALRGHCRDCGSCVFMMYDMQPEVIYMTAGTVDEKSVRGQPPPVSAHIFVGPGEKSRWYQLPEDGIPRLAGFGGEFEKRIAAWRASN